VGAEYRTDQLFILGGFILGLFNDAFILKGKGKVAPPRNSGQRHELAEWV
jgi:hypothetical protein